MEHLGIDAAGRTAPYVDWEQYLREMDWKRGVHAAHGTILIETFSHEHADGRLLRNLTEKLAAHGVTLSPIPREKVFDVLKQQKRIGSVHAPGGDLPAALQGQPAVLSRHRADWAGAHRGTRGGRKRS